MSTQSTYMVSDLCAITTTTLRIIDPTFFLSASSFFFASSAFFFWASSEFSCCKTRARIDTKMRASEKYC